MQRMNRCPARFHPAVARGAVLLEVIVALGLLVFGLAAVGLQINAGLDAARSADIGSRAVMLVDTKLAELDSGVVRPEGLDDELKGDFGVIYPGYSWRMQFRKTDIEEFYMVTLEIGYNASAVEEQIASPQRELEIDEKGTKIINTVYRLYAKPAVVNLQRDFGFDQTQLDELAQMVPIPGFDPSNIDPTAVSQLDPEMLQQLLPIIQEILNQGGNLADLQAAVAEANHAGEKGGGGRRGGRDGNAGRPDRGGDAAAAPNGNAPPDQANTGADETRPRGERGRDRNMDGGGPNDTRRDQNRPGRPREGNRDAGENRGNNNGNNGGNDADRDPDQPRDTNRPGNRPGNNRPGGNRPGGNRNGGNRTTR